jgi:hypothetical protein
MRACSSGWICADFLDHFSSCQQIGGAWVCQVRAVQSPEATVPMISRCWWMRICKWEWQEQACVYITSTRLVGSVENLLMHETSLVSSAVFGLSS